MQRRKLTVVVFALTLAVAVLPAQAQLMRISGSIGPGSTPTETAEKFEDEWNSGSDFDCETGSPRLIVTAVQGACDWFGVTLDFEIPSGLTTTVPHAFEYEIACASPNDLTHQLGFDATCSISGDPCFVPTSLPDQPGDCGPGNGDCVVTDFQTIDEGVFLFNLNGGDVFRITTTESYMGNVSANTQVTNRTVPSMGEWGAIIVGGAIALAAIVLILRRREV